jgi:hypothetical protein
VGLVVAPENGFEERQITKKLLGFWLVDLKKMGNYSISIFKLIDDKN